MAYALIDDQSGWKICKDVISGKPIIVELCLPKGTIIFQPNLLYNPVCGQVITVEFWRGYDIAEDVKIASSFMTSNVVFYERNILTRAKESYHEIPYYDGLHFFWTRDELITESPRYNLPTVI